MENENLNSQEQNTQQETQTQKETPKAEHMQMIPKARFDEINAKYKEVQAKLDQLLEERANAERAAKEQQGKFEELYNTANAELTKYKAEHKAASERAAKLESVINSLLEAKLEGVPEEFRDLIPSNLTPEEKLDWLTAAEKKGLFGARDSKRETPIGKATNPGQNQTIDLNKLSPVAMLRAAYGAK